MPPPTHPNKHPEQKQTPRITQTNNKPQKYKLLELHEWSDVDGAIARTQARIVAKSVKYMYFGNYMERIWFKGDLNEAIFRITVLLSSIGNF
jgi:hypothetical protein